MYVEKQGHKRCTGRFGESGANKVDPEKTFRVCLIIILWFLGDKKGMQIYLVLNYSQNKFLRK